MRISFNLYLFLLLSIISFSVFAGADPDELTLEEEMQQQEVVKEEVVKDETVKNDEKLEVQEEVVIIPNSCISFPEAIGHKEHFACPAEQEKNRFARINWSFSKLLLR
tara:strand:- start:56 stop:379 length:324 start_codon:yes stop_codon:yes gene_type:complete